MQGIKFNHQADKSRTKAAFNHPPLVLSTRAATNIFVKKPLWPPGSHLVPCALLQVPHSFPKLDIIQLPVPLNTYTPLAQYMPKRPQNQSDLAQATNFFFCPVWLPRQGSSALHLQMESPWLCSKLFLKPWYFTPALPCLCTLGWLLTPVPNLPAGLLVLFQPCLLPMTVPALSSTLITYNPIF